MFCLLVVWDVTGEKGGKFHWNEGRKGKALHLCRVIEKPGLGGDMKEKCVEQENGAWQWCVWGGGDVAQEGLAHSGGGGGELYSSQC